MNTLYLRVKKHTQILLLQDKDGVTLNFILWFGLELTILTLQFDLTNALVISDSHK